MLTGAFTSKAIQAEYTEEPTQIYRWRKKFLFGKTLEQAWKVTHHQDSEYPWSEHYLWKEVRSVKWNEPNMSRYA